MLKSFSHYSFLLGIAFLVLSGCNKPVALPPADPDNGGLILPGHFEALIVLGVHDIWLSTTMAISM
jgi:hypothetical protein